ncbi:MAG TPA: hypothetical protein VEK15_19270 [Vicinamibacteria bacterium]|nr:hypothetical protein [Vicinamibacteria bacterium]
MHFAGTGYVGPSLARTRFATSGVSTVTFVALALYALGLFETISS